MTKEFRALVDNDEITAVGSLDEFVNARLFFRPFP